MKKAQSQIAIEPFLIPINHSNYLLISAKYLWKNGIVSMPL